MKGQKVAMVLTVFAALILWVLAYPRDEKPQFYEPENASYTISVRDAEVETATTIEETTASKSINYIADIALDEDVQEFVFAIAEENNLSPFLIFAIIEVESQYDADATGDNGNSIGLMQVQPRWHSERMEALGVNDLYDPKNNITVAVDYFMDCLETSETLESALVKYNTGQDACSNAYSIKVLQKFIELEDAYGS